MMLIRCPCKNCFRRSAGCHGKCPDYKEYRAGVDAVRKERWYQAEADAVKRDSVNRATNTYKYKHLRGMKGGR